MIQLFCKHEMDNNKESPGMIMQCLITYRLDSRMNSKCAAGILHHQIVCLILCFIIEHKCVTE